MQCNGISIVGASGVGKTSFVLALGATELASQRVQYHWQRPGYNGLHTTTVRILRTSKEVLDSNDGIVVLLFDLMRRDSLAAVISQWAPLVDVMGRRLLLVGTHADCPRQHEISSLEVREISGEFDGYEEVCCRAGDKSMLRVQLTLNQWVTNRLASQVNDIPLARASICGGFPRPVVTMMMPNTTRCSPASPARQQHSCRRAEAWLCDPDEEGSSIPVATGVGSDVKLRTISKAIYDIRGAVAEKGKALAKYRDRQVSHWLTRSRYFGPTESSRHKRWQEEQKKHQLAQGHLRHHFGGNTRRQSSALDFLQGQRLQSVSHPNEVESPSEIPAALRGPTGSGRVLSSCNIEHEVSLATSLERKSFVHPPESTKQWQRQLAASNEPEQKKRFVAKRALRKQQRTASNDMFERSTTSAAAYLDCYDEMDMPPQLQPISPSLGRHTPLSILSPASSVASSSSRKSLGGNSKTLDPDIIDPSRRHSFELLSLGVERVGCLSASLSTTKLQLSNFPMMTSSTSSSQASSNRSRHKVDTSTLDSSQYDFLRFNT